MAQLAVPVLDEAVEELAQAHRAPRAAPRSERRRERGVESSRPGQVGAGGAEDEVADRAEIRVAAARVGEHRDDAPDELPPVADRRAREALEPPHQVGIAFVESGILRMAIDARSLSAASHR